MTSLRDLTEGDHLYNDDTDTILEIKSLGVDFSPDGLPEGTVVLEDRHEEFSADAETVAMDLHSGAMSAISDDVIENAERIIHEFASTEIHKYTSTIGRGHDFNGIDYVENVRDLATAARFASE